MATASNVAKYLLSLQVEDAGDLVSALKLQKLVYYCQGMHLALHDTPLFDDPIEAWTHGPVVRSLYNEYRDFKSDPLPIPSEEVSGLSDDEKELIEEVYQVFGQYSAWKLREMTHSERPYKETPKTGSDVIPQRLMREFFKAYLN